MSEGVLYYDRSGRLAFCNPAAASILGLPAEEMLGRPAHHPVGPAFREDGTPLAVEDHPATRVLRTGRPEREVVLGVRTPVRGLRWLSLNAELDRDEAGGTRGLVVTFLEVTHRLALAEDARISAERLSLVLEGSRDGFWDWDVPTGRVTYSERWASMLGYRPGELEPHVRAWERRVHPDDAPRVGKLVRSLLDGDIQHYECEHRVLRRDGTYAWILDRGTVVARDAGGRALRAAGTHTDVTAHRAAEDALAQSERRLAMVLDASHDGYWDSDLRTGTSVVSARWNEIVGRRTGGNRVEQEEWAGRLHPDDLPQTTRVIEAAMSGASRRFSVDYRVRCDDGTHRWVRSRGRAVEWDAEGRPARVVGTLTDVTAEKEAEARLRESEEQLRVASRLAAMGTLVAGVTHEMNNPLAGVTAGQTMALEDLDALRGRAVRGEGIPADVLVHRLDEVRASILDAQAGAERVARIVRELATFGRPEARRVAVRLPVVVEHALDVLPASVTRRVAVLVEDLGAPAVLGSPDPLAQVVVHLVTNAARSIPEGRRGRVVVRLGPGPPGTARLEVMDDGAGMSEEVRRRAFDPFFTTRDVGQGLGLGLTVCHAIVAAHGGTIAVESEPGRGSIFRVDLPVAPSPREEPGETGSGPLVADPGG